MTRIYPHFESEILREFSKSLCRIFLFLALSGQLCDGILDIGITNFETEYIHEAKSTEFQVTSHNTIELRLSLFDR